jgi:hypothetical protein
MTIDELDRLDAAKRHAFEETKRLLDDAESAKRALTGAHERRDRRRQRHHPRPPRQRAPRP